MNRKALIIVTVGCVGVICFILGLLLAPIFSGFMTIKSNEVYMQKPEVYEPVGRTLALYCQSDPQLFPSQLLSDPWLPAELRKMGHGWLSVSPDQARIEMGGGLYHYGYLLTRDNQASIADTNVWQLFLYGEDADDKLLLTLRILKTEAMSATSLFEAVLPGYDEQLAAHPDSLEAHQGKIQFLLHFNRVDEARAAVKELLHTMPDTWWANLVNALVVAETQSPEQAEQSLLDWVKREPNFFKYLDLAYYYQLQQQPQKAAQAMLVATQYNANTTWGHGGNAEFRGYNAAMYAFRSKQYEAAIKLSDKLLGVTINGNYAREDLLKLKDAAMKNTAGEKASLN